MSKVAYIAGPFRAKTPWLVEQNVRQAETVSHAMWVRGVTNICPHTMGRFLDKEVPDEIILKGTQRILLVSELVIVMPNWVFSEGTKAEIDLARKADIKVHFIKDFTEDAYNAVASAILGERTVIMNINDI